jgi:hypothetical protein
VARKELVKLEAAHPGRLGPLKAEIQRLVDEPDLDTAVLSLLDHRCCAPKVRSFVFHAHYLSIASPCEVLIEHSFADSSNQNWKPADSACKRKNGKRRRSAASALSGAWRRSTTSSGAGSLLGLIYRDQEESTPENGLASNRFQQSDFRIGPV